MRKVLFQKETPYGYLEVEDRGKERYLLVEGEMESCVSLPDLAPVLFPYMERFSYAWACREKIETVLLIGGGACSYPRWFLKHHEGTIDVIEISEEILKVSESYLGLSKDMDNPRLHVINAEAMEVLEGSEKKYDLILNDAFIGRTESARSLHDAQIIHAHLNPGGIYLMNTLGALKGPHALPLRKKRKLLETVFARTSVIVCDEDLPLHEKQNLLMAASDGDLL
jgi:spermidine synthase